jgi:hypothetical protein
MVSRPAADIELAPKEWLSGTYDLQRNRATKIQRRSDIGRLDDRESPPEDISVLFGPFG